MATFVLVHGAWHGAWCWELLTPRLEALGHRVIATDLPGMGNDKTPLASVTLDSWARFTADQCAGHAAGVVLVGHSRGGIVISQAAEYAPASVRRLVYLSAFLVQPGASLNSTLGADPDGQQPIPAVLGADGISISVTPDAVQPMFYNTSSAALAARAASLLVPEPLAPLGVPLTLTDANFGRVPRAYISCLRDQAITPAMQRRMYSVMPCDPVITMDTDHSPFYSAPDELAHHLAASSVSG